MIILKDRNQAVSPTRSVDGSMRKLIVCDDIASDLQQLMLCYRGDKEKLIEEMGTNKQFKSMKLEGKPGSVLIGCDHDPFKTYVTTDKVTLNGIAMLFLIEQNGARRPTASHRNFFFTIELLMSQLQSERSPKECVALLKPFMNRSYVIVDVIQRLNFTVRIDRVNKEHRSLKFLFVPLMAKQNPLPPSEVDVFSDGSSHASITMTVAIGVYSRSDLMQIGSLGKQILSIHYKIQEVDPKNLGDEKSQSLMRQFSSLVARIQIENPSLQPFITFQTILSQRVNFDTADSVRTLSIQADSITIQ